MSAWGGARRSGSTRCSSRAGRSSAAAEDEKALGNLLTLHAPFFQDRFFPESLVLRRW